ncbi:MAG: O-antigen ligase family protein [Rhodanobacter sp.]
MPDTHQMQPLHTTDVASAISCRKSLWPRIQNAALVAGQWCAIASLFVVPLNKPATNIALGLSIIFSLLGRDARARWLDALRHPVVQGALVWWAVLMLSALHTWYATASFPRTGSFVWACWYPLVFGSLLQTTQWRRRGLLAFAAAVGLVLLASYGMQLGLISQHVGVHLNPALRDTVFKEYTQQGMSTLMLACMAMAVAFVTTSKRVRRVCLLVVVLALVNVMFMLESRTTVLTLVPLVLYWLWQFIHRQRLDKRLVFAIPLLAAAVFVVALQTPSIQTRLVDAIPQEIDQYLNSRQPTSTGIRLELWRQTIPIIASAPLFGHGLRAWEPLYRESIAGLPHFAAFNMGHPHQEMLLIAAEQGLVGLAVFLFLLAALARYLWRLDRPERDFFICVLLIYLTAGLANGLWADFTHRHVFILLLACIPVAARSQAVKPAGDV